MRAAFLIACLLVPALSARSPADPVGERLPLILEAWKHRVEMNRGVHAWNRRNDGMRVFQEWIALLTLAREASPAERKRTGQALEKYVVGGDIRPLGFIGTSLPMPGYDDGDFDMALLGCVSLLHLFRDDPVLLTDKTLLHLVTKVVRLWGQSSKSHFEVFFVSVPETENHLFMIESSRFLTNQLIVENSRRLPALAALRDSLVGRGINLDNRSGNLKRRLLKTMHQAMCKGFFEFNAQIYQRFTIHALDNLYSFSADAAVADAAGCLLDYLSASFAFQSFGSLRQGPFRRSSEVYLDSTLVNRDAACSFFAIQSGAFPWSADPRTGLWAHNTAHASLALYSAVLGYRIPAPILHYLRERPAEYRAEIRSAYADGGRRVTEVYHGGPGYLLTGGGRYENYDGPNFPTSRLWFKDAPWVYDVITRSSSLLLDPMSEKPRLLRDILHFRGEQWRANNLAVHRNFLYGYVPAAAANSPEWPQHVPAEWKADTATSVTRDFDFRFVDRSDAGVYLVLGRIRPARTYLRWGYQKFLRGTVEVVDTSRAASLAEVKDRTLAHNSPGRGWTLGRRYVYTTFDGARIHLSARYDGGRDGIIKVAEPPDPDTAAPAVALPFRFPWSGGEAAASTGPLAGLGNLPLRDKPHFQVEAYSPWRGRVALSDGKGNMYVFNPATGGYCLSNFRSWWNPRRKVHDPEAPPDRVDPAASVQRGSDPDAPPAVPAADPAVPAAGPGTPEFAN